MKKILSVILPVFNEKETIEKVVHEWVNELEKLRINYQIIVCEDGSTDGTQTVLKNIQRKYRLKLSQKNQRRGYGGAVIDGIKSVNSTYILSVDSDGQCDPQDFKKFWESRDKHDILIGYRVNRNDPASRKIYSLFFKLYFKILFPTNLHDPSAPFVLYKKEIILPYLEYLKFLKEGFWWGFVATSIKAKLSLAEFPINHRERLAGKTRVYEIKKIPAIAFKNLLGLTKLKFAPFR